MRSGSLFEGRFKNESVLSDAHLLSVIRYVHMNPVKAGLSKSPNFPWSSYYEIVSGCGWTDCAFATSLFGGLDEFTASHEAQEKDFSFLDIGSGTRRRVTEMEAQNAAADILGDIDPHSVLQMDRAERDRAPALLQACCQGMRLLQALSPILNSACQSLKKVLSCEPATILRWWPGDSPLTCSLPFHALYPKPSRVLRAFFATVHMVFNARLGHLFEFSVGRIWIPKG